jgi:hypothetical protein
VDNIIIKEPYEFPCFNYPNSIEINYSDYDSILFEGGEINYFDLKKEKMVTTKFKTNKININPSGELSAHYNSHTNPILIVFEKAIGYKNGASHNIKKINKSIEIKLKSISLLDDQEYKRINERSNLSLMN